MRTYTVSFGLIVVTIALGLFLKHVPFQPYLFLFGGAFSGLGLHVLCGQIAFLQKSRIAGGELVDWKEERAPRRASQVLYYAVITFEDADGKSHRITSATGSSPKPGAPMGTRIPVRYKPENPDDARVDTFWDYWAPPVIILLFGAALVVISFYAVHTR